MSSSRKRKQKEEHDSDEAEEDNGGDDDDNELLLKQPTTTKTAVNLCVDADGNEDEDDDEDEDEDDDGGEKEEEMETSVAEERTIVKTKTTPTKLKCLKCSRSARKDCTGSLCIKCCADINCVVHEEQRAKTRWKESVMNGTTDIQQKAKYKKLRAIPKGRFKEIEFKYMNDTVVLFDLRTLLEPSLPSSSSQSQSQSQKESTTSIEQNNGSSSLASPSLLPSVDGASVSASASDIAKYNNDIKIKEEILRKSRKNAYVYDERGGVRSNRKNIRNIIDNLYRKKFAC